MRCLITQFIVALIVYYHGALMPVVCLLSYFSRYHGDVPDLLQRVLYFFECAHDQFHLLFVSMFFMQFVFTFAVNVSPEYLAVHHCQISKLYAIIHVLIKG